jgi:multiple sugar transport system permease protein
MTTTAQIPLTIIEPEKRSSRWQSVSRALVSYSFLLPWLIGFLGLTLGPTLASAGSAVHRNSQLRTDHQQ